MRTTAPVAHFLFGTSRVASQEWNLIFGARYAYHRPVTHFLVGTACVCSQEWNLIFGARDEYHRPVIHFLFGTSCVASEEWNHILGSRYSSQCTLGPHEGAITHHLCLVLLGSVPWGGALY